MTTIDDLLGPPGSRYLTGAVRQVRRTVQHVVIRAAEDGGIRVDAIAGVLDPRTQSEGLTPHLDMVDAILLAAELTDCALAFGRPLEPEARRHARLLRIDLWSGSRPERQLGVIPVTAELRSDQVRGRIGPLRFRLGLQLDGVPVRPEARRGFFKSSIDLLEDPTTRYWALGFRQSTREVRGVTVNPQSRSVAASVTVSEPAGGCPNGLDAAHRPHLTPLDGLMIAPQLAKALICTLDGVDPAERESMWIRRATCRIASTPETIDAVHAAALTTESVRPVVLGGERWHSQRMAGVIGSISGSLAFANRSLR